ncbi:hypothetical protein HYT53_06195 [Candidatus Woesearchaeota archaeon]|nr:hypothetical protein [Candidatus Woesearchaeota archaeon]
MKFWKKLKYWQKGGVIGLIIGLVKIPFFVLMGESMPSIFVYYAGLIPDQMLCNFLNLGSGESCGWFALIYGFIYNPIFFGMIGMILGLCYSLIKKKSSSNAHN